MAAVQIPRPGPDGQISVRSLQAAFESINTALAGQGDTSVLTRQITTLLALVARQQQQISALQASVAILLAASSTYVAGTTLGIGTPVFETAPGIVSRATNNFDVPDRAFIGLSTAQAAIGAKVRIARNELLTYAGWSWTDGPVYLDDDGTLTQDLPTGTPFIVGVAVGPTSIEVNSFAQGVDAVDNLGTGGYGVLSHVFDGTIYGKSLFPDLGVTMRDTIDGIYIGAEGGGVESVSNLGGEQEVLIDVVGSVLRARTIAGVNEILVETIGNVIYVSLGTASSLVTEAGDFITTETGDRLVVGWS